MIARRLSRLGLCIAVISTLFACRSEVFPPSEKARPAAVPVDPKVVLFVIDGPRYEDSFGDSLHAHVPGMWNELRPLGTLCSDFRNMGWTSTIPGHSTLLTGVWQYIANDGSQRPQEPTLFEYYRKETGAPPRDAVLVGEKAKLAACAYSLDPAYGAAFGALTDIVEFTGDIATYDRLIARLQTDRPHFVMAAFAQVDLKGHTGVWSDYLRQIEIVDSLAVLTWSYLQSDPEYAGQTYMFITADHGRHDDAHGGFQGHGDDCWGCRHLVFLALGPDIRADYEVTTLYTQRDVCTTIGMLLGIATPRSDGFPINELFVPTPTGIRD